MQTKNVILTAIVIILVVSIIIILITYRKALSVNSSRINSISSSILPEAHRQFILPLTIPKDAKV